MQERPASLTLCINRILASSGAVVAEDDPNSTSLYHVSLFFNTSFMGTDQLQVRLTAGSEGLMIM